MLKLQSVSKIFSSFSDQWYFGPVNLEIKQGKFMAILGKSGSGKSTLLHLAGGLLTPDTGNVLFENQNLNVLNDQKLSQYRNREMGFVFQDFYLLEDQNVFQNVAISLKIQGGFSQNEIKVKVQKILEQVDLSELSLRYPRELSGGQKQRVAIARAFVNNPKIVFADEPTGNLDQKSGLKIIDLLTEFHQKQKTTIVCVTHDEEIGKRANRVIKIEEGKIL